jgi:predicted DNA binding CopG/RHH family protein
MKEKTLILKQMYFSKCDVNAIQQEAKDKGINFSEMTRRILSKYVQEQKSKK